MNAAEYPGALWMPADRSNIVAGRHGPVEGVCIHCTDGHADPRGTARMWQEPHHGSSAHFVVGQDGEVVQAASIDDCTWHAHIPGLKLIGIEHSARTPKEWGANDAGMMVTPIQMAASAKLAAWLCKRLGLTVSRKTFVGHAECDPKTTHVDCPTGAGINLDEYVALVQAAM